MRLSPALWPEAALTLFRTFGVRGGALRAAHELRRAGGRFRAAPRQAATSALPPRRLFEAEAKRLRAGTDREIAIARAERVAAGEHQAYRHEWRALPADAAAWLRHPVTGRDADAAAPWWRIEHLGADFGDIKDLWEPARFAWVYDLVRGYLVTGHARYPEAFQRHFDQWLESSPPFRGPHWSCGQETTIRAAALLYAESNLAGAPGLEPELWDRVQGVLAASGERIADAIGYAVSQRNNHAISEAAGLVMLGVRLRGQHPEAEAWLARGRRLLERLVLEQFADDGWYIQHSFTYLRVALDQCVLAERALRSLGPGLSAAAAGRLAAAVDLLLAVIDPLTGQVPNHGANDGAFVHPITLAGYRDFRPVITAVCALWRKPMPYDLAPDPEVPTWLGCEAPPRGPGLADGLRYGLSSGWASARIGSTVAFLRAGRYSSRPGHVDPLHLDVRLAGHELVVDAGTFAYNAPAPWRNGLAGAEVHNGPIVDDREPGVRGPRFLWLLWPEALLASTRYEKGVAEMVARVRGSHERRVVVRADAVTVEDRALNRAARELRVRWLLHPAADPAGVVVSGGSGRVMESPPGSTLGWFSEHYGERVRAPIVEARQALPADRPLTTELTLAGVPASADGLAALADSNRS